MAQPPATPPSSDIDGVDRDAFKHRARGKPAEPGQQEELANAADGTVARPDYEPDITSQGNAQ